MTLSRIILSVKAEHLSSIRTNWLTKVFVTGDVVLFVVQGGGGGLMAVGNGKNMKLGQNIIVSGLMIQVIMFGLFGITAAVFHKRICKDPTTETYEVEAKWQQYLYMLYVASAFIMFRSIFRVVEFSVGHDGYLLKNEWTLYVFDAVLMWLFTIIFFWRYPSDVKEWKRRDLENVQLRSIEIEGLMW